MAQVPINSLKWWHVALIEYRMTYPTAKNNEVAAHFGKSPAWVSTITHTPEYKAAEERAKKGVIDHVTLTTARRIEAVAERVMDQMIERLDTEQIPFDTLRATMVDSLGAMGIGMKSPLGVTNQQNNVFNMSFTPEQFAAAQQKLRTVNGDIANGSRENGVENNDGAARYEITYEGPGSVLEQEAEDQVSQDEEAYRCDESRAKVRAGGAV